MKRVQLFEFEDFNWFPKRIRQAMTNLIAVLHKMVGTGEVISALLAPVLKDKEIDRMVDLGSGSGGIMPQVLSQLRSARELKDLQLLLTDLYPNDEMIRRWSVKQQENVSYHPSPVDATHLDKAPKGLKTMINSFHHMRPKNARAILESAYKGHQPIFIYEMGENNIPLLLWWILLPLSLAVLIIMVLFMTPFVKPLSWQQVVFTYIIPVIPLCYAWDGQASLPRMYTMKDLDELLQGIQGPDYSWKKGQARKKNGKKLGTYIIGLPNN